MKRKLLAGKEGELFLCLETNNKGESETHLYLYGEVGWEIQSHSLAVAIDELDSDESITVHINSQGGNVFEGFSIYEKIRGHTGETVAIVEGLAASIASLIMCGCDSVHAYETSRVMIHKASTYTAGTADDLRKQADRLDAINQTLIEVYGKRTNLTEEEIDDAMSSETWYTGIEAEVIGFVDTVLNVDPAKEEAKMPDKKIDYEKRASEIRSLFAEHPEHEQLMFTCIGNIDLTMNDIQAKLDEVKVESEPKPTDPAENEPDSPQNKDTPAITAEANVKRVNAIVAAFKPHEGHSDLMFECVGNVNCTVDVAKAKLLDALGKESEQQGEGLNKPTVGPVGDNWRKQFVGAAVEAVLQKKGIEPEKDSPYKELRNKFRNHSLLDFARHSLEQKNIAIHGSKLEIVAAAFQHGTGDFIQILEDSARKSMLRGYTEMTSYHNVIARTGSLMDFKVNKLVGLGAFGDLDKIDPQGEYKFGTLSEFGEDIQLATYGKQFAITREAIINDDLNAFTRIPMKMGAAVSRMYGNMTAELLAGNGRKLKRDNKALFHADHNNTGKSVPSTDALVAADVAMTTQVAEGGIIVEAMPRYVYCPRRLKAQFDRVINSQFHVGETPENNNSSVPNVAPNLTVLGDPRLDMEDPLAWYVLADPNMTDTMEIAFLDGEETPMMEQYQENGRDGLFYRVRADVGVSVLDYKGIYRGNNS